MAIRVYTLYILKEIEKMLCVGWHDTNVKIQLYNVYRRAPHKHKRKSIGSSAHQSTLNCDCVCACACVHVSVGVEPLCGGVYRIGWTFFSLAVTVLVNDIWVLYCTQLKAIHYEFKRIHTHARTHTHAEYGIERVRSTHTYNRHSRKFPIWVPIFNALLSAWIYSHIVLYIQVKNTRLSLREANTKIDIYFLT